MRVATRARGVYRDTLEAEANAKFEKWLDAQKGAVTTRIAELKKSVRPRAEAMVADVRSTMKAAAEKLCKQLHDTLSFDGVNASFYSEADITRLVSTSLDGFIDDFGNRVKSTLKDEMKKLTDEALGVHHGVN
jgi:hypothetical protein